MRNGKLLWTRRQTNCFLCVCVCVCVRKLAIKRTRRHGDDHICSHTHTHTNAHILTAASLPLFICPQTYCRLCYWPLTEGSSCICSHFMFICLRVCVFVFCHKTLIRNAGMSGTGNKVAFCLSLLLFVAVCIANCLSTAVFNNSFMHPHALILLHNVMEFYL